MPFGATDVPGLETAIAQEGAAERPADEGGPPSEQQQGGAWGAAGPPTDPELLYPPGRLLWIFPADEDLGTLTGGDAAVVAAGVAAGAAEAAASAAAGRGSVRRGPGAAVEGGVENMNGEIELTAAGAVSAEQHAQQAEQRPQRAQRVSHGDLDALRHETEAARDQLAAKEAQHVQRGERAPAGAAGQGALDMDAAMRAVEAWEGAGSGGAAEGEHKAGGVPVVVEAERHRFERILLMPGGWCGGYCKDEGAGLGDEH